MAISTPSEPGTLVQITTESGTCKRTLKQFVTDLAYDLNDYERFYTKDDEMVLGRIHERWSPEFLTQTINNFIRALNLMRPDIFTNVLTGVPLKAGCSDQELPVECLQFRSVEASGCGGIQPLRISSTQMATISRLHSRACAVRGVSVKGDPNYHVENFSSDPENPRWFRVSPPPPPNTVAEVVLTCVLRGPCYTWGEDQDRTILELDAELGFNNPLLDLYEEPCRLYVLAQGYLRDVESEFAHTRVEAILARMFAFLNVVTKADYTYHHPDLFLIGPDNEESVNAFVQ